MPIDPYKQASDEIHNLIILENNRLHDEKLKLERDIIVAYLNDVIKQKLADKKSIPVQRDDATRSLMAKEIDEDISKIKSVIKTLSAMKMSEKVFFSDFSRDSALLLEAHIPEFNKKTDTYNAANDVFSAICRENAERKVLINKINVTTALADIARTTKDHTLPKALENAKVTGNDGKPINAIAVMNERRGKSPNSFWGLVERVFAKFGVKAPTLGVKSAKAMSKIDHTLFQAKKAADKLPKIDTRDDVDDTIKPKQ